MLLSYFFIGDCLTGIKKSRANLIKKVELFLNYEIRMGGSPGGLVVMGGDSCSEGPRFKCHHRILDGHFLHLFVVKIVMFAWKDKNKRKRGWGWPSFNYEKRRQQSKIKSWRWLGSNPGQLRHNQCPINACRKGKLSVKWSPTTPLFLCLFKDEFWHTLLVIALGNNFHLLVCQRCCGWGCCQSLTTMHYCSSYSLFWLIWLSRQFHWQRVF